MKKLKILYFVAVSICLLELVIFLVRPFGGGYGIFYLMKTGMFTLSRGFQLIFVESQYYPGSTAVKNLERMNQILTIAYFVSLIGASSTFLWRNLDLKKKYLIGISLFLSSILFSIAGGAIWRALANHYLP